MQVLYHKIHCIARSAFTRNLSLQFQIPLELAISFQALQSYHLHNKHDYENSELHAVSIATMKTGKTLDF